MVPVIRSLVPAAVFAILGTALMAWGYAAEYTASGFVMYFLCFVLFGSGYLAYFGFMAPRMRSLEAWLFLFLLFPKKPLPPVMPALLNGGLGQPDAFIPIYGLLEVPMVAALLVAAFRGRPRRGAPDPPDVRLVRRAFFGVALVGVFHVVLLRHFYAVSGTKLASMLLELWPVLVGAGVAMAAARLRPSHEDRVRLFAIMFVAGAVLTTELILGKFTPFLPGAVLYHTFNYRGGFRSIIAAGDLFVDQIMVFAIAVAMFYYLAADQKRYLAAAALFFFAIIETFNRTGIIAGLIAGTLPLLALPGKRRWLYVGGGVIGLAIGILLAGGKGDSLGGDMMSLLAPRQDLYGGGLLGLSSTFGRLGTYMRGIDVAAYAPVLGVGPGNLPVFMNAAEVPSFVELLGFSPGRIATALEYQRLLLGSRTTLPHNLYLRDVGEYGLAGLLLVAAFIWAGWRRYVAIRIARKARSVPRGVAAAQVCALSALAGLAFYFIFQPAPLVYGAGVLLLSLAVDREKDARA